MAYELSWMFSKHFPKDSDFSNAHFMNDKNPKANVTFVSTFSTNGAVHVLTSIRNNDKKYHESPWTKGNANSLTEAHHKLLQEQVFGATAKWACETPLNMRVPSSSPGYSASDPAPEWWAPRETSSDGTSGFCHLGGRLKWSANSWVWPAPV